MEVIETSEKPSRWTKLKRVLKKGALQLIPLAVGWVSGMIFPPAGAALYKFLKDKIADSTIPIKISDSTLNKICNETIGKKSVDSLQRMLKIAISGSTHITEERLNMVISTLLRPLNDSLNDAMDYIKSFPDQVSYLMEEWAAENRELITELKIKVDEGFDKLQVELDKNQDKVMHGISDIMRKLSMFEGVLDNEFAAGTKQIFASKVIDELDLKVISKAQLSMADYSSRFDITYDPDLFVVRDEAEEAFIDFMNHYLSPLSSGQNCFLILAGAGMGKTWLLSDWAHKLSTAMFDLPDVDKFIPFFISLKLGFKTQLDAYFGASNKRQALNNLSKVKDTTNLTPILFIDGLDEIRPDKAKSILNFSLEIINEKIPIIIACRDSDWSRESNIVDVHIPIKEITYEHKAGSSYDITGVDCPPSLYLGSFNDHELNLALKSYHIPSQALQHPQIREMSKRPILLRLFSEYYNNRGVLPNPGIPSQFEDIFLGDVGDPPETHILGRLGIIGPKRGYLIRLVREFVQKGAELKENDLTDLINETENFKTVRSSGIIKEKWGRLGSVYVLDNLFQAQLEHMVELDGGLPEESVITPTVTAIPTKTTEQRIFQTHLVNASEIEILKAIQKEIGTIIESHQFETNDKGNVSSINLSSLTLKDVPKSVSSLPQLEEINFSDDSFETDQDLSNLMYDGKVVKIGGIKYIEGQIRGRIENTNSIKQGEANLNIRQLYKAIKWFEQSKELCTKFGWENGINYAEEMISEIKNTRKEQEKKAVRKKAEEEEQINLPVLKQLLQNKIHASLRELSEEMRVHHEIIQIYLEKIALTHKDSDQYWLKPEEFPKFLTTFRNSQVLYYQAEILKEIEKYIKSETNKDFEFTIVDKIEHDTRMGLTIQDNQITGIGLYNCELSTLPEALGFLYSLRVLGLSENKLKSFPDSFQQLSILKVLILDYNDFETLPSLITDLTMLQELYLRYNKLYNLPDPIKNLKTLRRLDVDNNKITVISPESIENLVSLKDLRLSNNQLANLPESIGHLKSLELLRLNNNPLANLPKTIVNLKSLKFLYLKGTKIASVPRSLQTLKQKGQLSIFL